MPLYQRLGWQRFWKQNEKIVLPSTVFCCLEFITRPNIHVL